MDLKWLEKEIVSYTIIL